MPMILAALFASIQIQRHALLIGINDYTASHLTAAALWKGAPGRDWPDLHGAVNDANGLQEMLTARCGFDRQEITTLTDQAATRDAILQSIRSRLIEGVKKGDIVFFYFAGHGSQVLNSKSDEPDKLDESIVPADSRLGAPDIRDKELRRLFNAILERGARLTVMIDACHSGSGARGLPTGVRSRGIAPDLRDIADGGPYGPRPENRGALVLAASQDFASASETPDQQHGVFTWAWMRSLRAATPGEPAIETFLRAQARLRGETPFQNPVLAGNENARRTPFLGADAGPQRAVVAVQRIRSDGTAVLEGGWANGLSVGTVLQQAGTPGGPRFVITSIDGLVRSTARIEGQANRMSAPGVLLEIAAWAAPPAAQLTVSIPHTSASAGELRTLADALQRAATKRGLKWVADPVVSTPGYVLRWDTNAWELLQGPAITRFESPVAAVATIESGSSFFLQLPVPRELADEIRFPGNAVVRAERPQEAHYILVGRYHHRTLEYAWVRPGVSRADRYLTSLPSRSVWLPYTTDDATAFEYRALCLHKILAWNELESPPYDDWPYHLDMQERLTGGETYPLVMRTRSTRAAKRYVYVFAIDSYGQSTLLSPPSGSVENRFPVGDDAPPEVALGRISVTPPYGIDTYCLLTTDEPLANPWVLQWDGIRGERPEAPTALEQLLAQTSSAVRSPGSIVTPVKWSIERVIVESIPPGHHKKEAAVSHEVGRSK
ncbi:MAG TPA: caspase family protein [Thermoanaerobaculia bacterium]